MVDLEKIDEILEERRERKRKERKSDPNPLDAPPSPPMFESVMPDGSVSMAMPVPNDISDDEVKRRMGEHLPEGVDVDISASGLDAIESFMEAAGPQRRREWEDEEKFEEMVAARTPPELPLECPQCGSPVVAFAPPVWGRGDEQITEATVFYGCTAHVHLSRDEPPSRWTGGLCGVPVEAWRYRRRQEQKD